MKIQVICEDGPGHGQAALIIAITIPRGLSPTLHDGVVVGTGMSGKEVSKSSLQLLDVSVSCDFFSRKAYECSFLNNKMTFQSLCD